MTAKIQTMTQQGATMTTVGRVPHKLHPRGFLMPVKLVLFIRRGATYKAPVIDSAGQFVYALPGGGAYIVGE